MSGSESVLLFSFNNRVLLRGFNTSSLLVVIVFLFTYYTIQKSQNSKKGTKWNNQLKKNLRRNFWF